MAIDSTLIVTLLVFAFGAAFLYFIGTVIIQALRLSIIQVKSDVQIKMDKHHHELEHQQIYLESKRLRLQGKTVGEIEEKSEPKNQNVTTVELAIDGDTAGLKEALESIEEIKKFAIFKNNLLLDIGGDMNPTQLIGEIEKATKVTVKQVHFAKNPEKTVVKDKG
jgi:hypothetical protein